LLALGIKHLCLSFEKLVDFHDIWWGGDAIQGNLDAVTFNPIGSTISKWLRFKFQIFSPAQQWFGIGNQGKYFTKESVIILN
jgi:hypothetical protein